ncbi:MAG: hypothetical protein A2W31_10120 [Planctomycetes bacterium RBG_16_64_10]|nr:MAG: hypothetical protein A2W31_10120 [Planctomycetes bacterium RBG_16_64_10]
MSRQCLDCRVVLILAVVTAVGCHPTQPFYFFEDGDLSHYLDVATEIEYPDVAAASIDEVAGAEAPLTLDNSTVREFWDLSLEEAIQITLANSKVLRDLGGRIASAAPDVLSRNILSNQVKTVYDPAIVETGAGGVTGTQLSGVGVEAALSEFDARFGTSVFWEKNDRPQNNFLAFSQQDLGRFTAEISKTAVTGGTFAFRNNTFYDANNSPTRVLPSDWTTQFEAEFSQPLLQGAGAQYNRIAGPMSFNAFGLGGTSIDGVLIARVRVDLTLADFEAGVIEVVRSAEDAYWELFFAYRNLETRRIGRDSALQTWRKVHALKIVSARGGEAEREAQARSQYYFFRAEVETALTELYRAENRLRYTMGLAVADGRLIRPSDEPSTAQVKFDWAQVHAEALARRVEIRKQKWELKKRELELIAARNQLLPRLDAVGRYRWLGLGDDLVQSSRTGLAPLQPGSNAFETLTDGDFQEWQLGLQLNLPVGFRRQLAQVRHHQLLLARERALLEDAELEISHQLGDAERDLSLFYRTSQTNFNRLVASEKEVRAVESAYTANTVTLDLLLDAQRRRADSETAYYRSLVDFNRAIARVHDRKGSLLEYNGVYLAEGPWPGKAYFDALRRARRRDASYAVNYGFTRPKVISRGPYPQHGQDLEPALDDRVPTEVMPEEIGVPSAEPEDALPEMDPLPAPTDAQTTSAPAGPATTEPGRQPATVSTPGEHRPGRATPPELRRADGQAAELSGVGQRAVAPKRPAAAWTARAVQSNDPRPAPATSTWRTGASDDGG